MPSRLASAQALPVRELTLNPQKRRVEEVEDQRDTPDPRTYSPPETSESDLESQFDDEIEEITTEDLVLATHEEVDVLFTQLNNEFAERLQNAQIRAHTADKLKARPSAYKKVNATHRNTLALRKQKAEKQRAEMRSLGYADIQTLMNRPPAQISIEGNDGIEGMDSPRASPPRSEPNSCGFMSGEQSAEVVAEVEELDGVEDMTSGERAICSKRRSYKVPDESRGVEEGYPALYRAERSDGRGEVSATPQSTHPMR